MDIRAGAKALWVVAFCPFLLGTLAPAHAAISFSNQVVTSQAPPPTGCVVPTPATSFLTTDNTVYLFFEATVTTSDALTFNWLAPSGTVVAGGYWASNSGGLCFTGASLSIGNLSTSQLGSWQARVYDNGNLLFSVPFTVTGFSNQTVTTQAPPASGCIVPPAVTSFLTTAGIVYLYFDGTVATSDSLNNDWLAPDGTVITGAKWRPSQSGYFCFDNAPGLAITNLPAAQLGSWQARVYDNGKLVFSVPFTVAAPQTNGPILTSLSPSSAMVGGAAFTLTVNGSGFFPSTNTLQGPIPGTAVQWNGTVLTTTFVSATQLTAAVPASDIASAGTAQVTVVYTGPSNALTFTIASSITVTNAASLATEISPGSLVSLFGNGNVLATTTTRDNTWPWRSGASLFGNALVIATTSNLPLPTAANGTSVTINGILCPLIFVSPGQIGLQAPMELQPGPATVIVNNNGQLFSTTVQVLTAAPGIFTTDEGILRAVPGQTLTMYFTGIGPVTNSPGTGKAALESPSLSQSTSAVSVTFNGISVQPSSTVLAPGFVGLGRVSFQLPASIPSGNSTPVFLTIDGVSSQTVRVHVGVHGSPVAPGSFTLTMGTPGTGTGAVGSSPAGTSCGSGCLSFAEGTVVTLTATPSTGSTFAGWSGACSGTGNCTVTMNSNRAVTATFNLTVTTAVPMIGAANVTPMTAVIGTPTQVTVTASIADPSLTPGSVKLLQLNSDGTTTTLGILHDDGINGDLFAGDLVFTLVVTLDAPSATGMQLQVSAAFTGQSLPVLSQVMSVYFQAANAPQQALAALAQSLASGDQATALSYINPSSNATAVITTSNQQALNFLASSLNSCVLFSSSADSRIFRCPVTTPAGSTANMEFDMVPGINGQWVINSW